MDWPNEIIMEFLKLYQMHPCIWDPKHGSHKNKSRVNEAWEKIANDMGEPFTVQDLKRKKDSVMAAYRLNKTKVKKSEISGTGEVYKPTWFAFDFMDNFLGSIYTACQNTKTNENNFEEEINTTGEDVDDTKYIIYAVEADPLKLERESSSSIQDGSTNKGNSSRKSSLATANKRRQNNTSELQPTENQIDQAINVLKTVTQHTQQQHTTEEDECYYFGKLIEKKMRKLPEDRRDLMMIKINQLLYEEQYENNSTSTCNE